MERKSNVGDWIFLVAMIAVVVAYFSYENMADIQAWLIAAQAPAPAQHTVANAGMGEWLAQNWGLAMLGVALVVTVIKWVMTQRGQAVVTEGVVVAYKRFKFVNVKLVR